MRYIGNSSTKWSFSINKFGAIYGTLSNYRILTIGSPITFTNFLYILVHQYNLTNPRLIKSTSITINNSSTSRIAIGNDSFAVYNSTHLFGFNYSNNTNPMWTIRVYFDGFMSFCREWLFFFSSDGFIYQYLAANGRYVAKLQTYSSRTTFRPL